MNSINFLKLDFRLIKVYGKFYLILPFLVIMLVFMESPAFALNYLFFFVIILSSTPFSLEAAEQCQKMYYSLPAKIHSMVLGRYLFLISVILSVLAIDSFAILYFESINKITNLEIFSIYLSAMIGSMLCMLQYPVFYKLGYEKGKLSSMLIYLVPAFLVFSLPRIISEISDNEMIKYILNILNGNIYIQVAAVLGVLIILTNMSYRVSCRICKKKEI